MYISDDFDLNQVKKGEFSNLLMLAKRDMVDDPWGSSSWQWGRWILFVIFVVFLIVVFLGTIRVNRKRRYLGQAPIRGTAWMTPPSYRQSERDYNANGSGHTAQDYVPKYTAEANDDDLGYYDARGEFHHNTKAEFLPPPTLIHEVDSNTSTSLERSNLPPPQSVVTLSTSLSNNPNANIPAYEVRGNVAIPDDASVNNLDFTRYNHIDPNTTNNTAMVSNDEDIPKPPKAA